MPELSVTFADVCAAADRLAGVAHRTPVLTSTAVDERAGAAVYFKCENFQRIGAFKFRGAYNALSRLSEEHGAEGVLTFSSGNHAQAVALASGLLDVEAVIVMPDDAPPVKLAATQAYLDRAGRGGRIVRYSRAEITREELGRRLAEELRMPIIPPYDHPHIIAGQGTAAKELFEEVGDLDVLLTPCGGGGLLAGSAVSAAALCPSCRVIGVEPELADDATRSFRTGTIQTVHNPPTIADGARTPYLGTHNFPIIREHVADMRTVSEEQIIESMLFVWSRIKIVIEPTAALPVAGLFDAAERSADEVTDKRIGVIISGGNFDMSRFGESLRAE